MSSLTPAFKRAQGELIATVVLLAVHLLLNLLLLVFMRKEAPPLAMLSTLVILTVLILLLVGYVSKPTNVLRFKWPCVGLLALHVLVSLLFAAAVKEHKPFAVLSLIVVVVSLICFGLVLGYENK